MRVATLGVALVLFCSNPAGAQVQAQQGQGQQGQPQQGQGQQGQGQQGQGQQGQVQQGQRGQQGQPQRQQFSVSDTPLQLEVAVRGYLAGGRMGSLAGDSAVDRVEGYVWADQTLCAMGAGDQAPANVPWTGWHFTGNVLVNSPGEMMVDVHWERLWENGARITNGPSGAHSYRLRSGERVELDRIAPSNVGRCGTVEAKLEAAVMARAAYLMSGGVVGGARGGVARGMGGVASRPMGSANAGTGGRGGRGAGAGTGSGVVAGGAGAGVTGGVARGVPGGVAGGRGRGSAGGDCTTPDPFAAQGGGTCVNGQWVPTSAVYRSRAGGRGGAGAGVGSGTGATGVSAGPVGGVRGGVAAGVSGAGAGSTGAGVAGGGRGGRMSQDSVAAGSLRDSAQMRLALQGSYDAEIWLVHKEPGGNEVVQRQTVRFGAISRTFAFPPVQIAGSGGPITIDITGTVQLLNGPPTRYTLGFQGRAGRGTLNATANAEQGNPNVQVNTSPLLVVSIARRAQRTTPFIDTRGTTDLSLQIPQPNDVLSFELPPLQKATEDLLKGHTFSLRLRLTAVK